MAFNRQFFSPVGTEGHTSVFSYATAEDNFFTVVAEDYFNEVGAILQPGSVIIISSKFGAVIVFVNDIERDANTNTYKVHTQSSATPALESPIAGSSPTRAEIETALSTRGIEVPLTNSTSFFIYDSSGGGTKEFLCHYAQSRDFWFYEKLTLATNSNEVTDDSTISAVFAVAVSNNNKILRAEIETAIIDAGFNLPNNNITITIRDTTNDSKRYLCSYDGDLDNWYFEKLTLAT